MAYEPTDRKYDCYREFFQKPETMVNRVFYEWIHKWCNYLLEHKENFNYLEDDKWKEIRERLLAELERREDIKWDFEEICDEIEAVDSETEFKKRVELQREFLDLMRTNQFECEFTDEQIADGEEKLEKMIKSNWDWWIAKQELKIARKEKEKSLADLDDKLAEYYERTGKRPVLTSLMFGRKKGN